MDQQFLDEDQYAELSKDDPGHISRPPLSIWPNTRHSRISQRLSASLPHLRIEYPPVTRFSGRLSVQPPVDGPGGDGSQDSEPEWKPSRAFVFAFTSLTLISLSTALESSSLSLALPKIAEDLHGTSVEAFWAGTSFMLASAVSQPIFASISILLGRKLMIQVSCALFGGGSIVGALADNFTILLAGRTIMGVGGGGITTLTETTITDLVPLRYRASYLGYLSSAWAIGTVLGPFVGAVFTQKVTWRWIFWIMVPVVSSGFVAITIFLNQTPVPGSLASKLGRFDWIGAIGLTAALVGLLVGLSWGGIQYPWDDWKTWFPITQGIEGVIGIATYEFIFAKEPIITKNIFNNATIIICYATGILHGAILWCLVYYVVIYYEGVKLYGNITTALALLPETLTVVPSAAVAGFISTKTGRYREMLWVGWALAIFGSILLTLLDRNTTVFGWILLNLPIGIATGLLFTPLAVGIQAAGRPEDAGQAAAFFSFSRTFGQAVGVSLGGAILQNRFKAAADGQQLIAPQADNLSHNVEGLIGYLQSLPTGDTIKDELIETYTDSLQTVWFFLAGLGGIALVLSFFIKSYSLDQVLMAQQRLVEKKDDQKDQKGGV